MLNSYVKTEELDNYVTNDQFEDKCNTWAEKELANYVPYDAEIHIQSKADDSGGGGNLSDHNFPVYYQAGVDIEYLYIRSCFFYRRLLDNEVKQTKKKYNNLYMKIKSFT